MVRGPRRVFLDERDGPLPALLLALTVLAGVVDATNILRLGHVFVGSMTGNLVFIGLAAAGAKGFAVGTSALALGGFVVGVGWICRWGADLLVGRAGLLGRIAGRALRNVLAVKLWLAGVLTDRASGWSDPKMLRRGLTLVAFAVGALSGALLILNVGLVAVLLFGLGILVSAAIAAHFGVAHFGELDSAAVALISRRVGARHSAFNASRQVGGVANDARASRTRARPGDKTRTPRWRRGARSAKLLPVSEITGGHDEQHRREP